FKPKEKAFIEGPVGLLCERLEAASAQGRPIDADALWDFFAEHRFTAMAIPVEHGGLGLGAWAQSEVLHRVALRSVSVAYLLAARFVFGPAAVLRSAATPEQAAYW